MIFAAEQDGVGTCEPKDHLVPSVLAFQRPYVQCLSPGPAINQIARVLPAVLEENITSLLEHGVVGQALSAGLGDGHGTVGQASTLSWIRPSVR